MILYKQRVVVIKKFCTELNSFPPKYKFYWQFKLIKIQPIIMCIEEILNIIFNIFQNMNFIEKY